MKRIHPLVLFACALVAPNAYAAATTPSGRLVLTDLTSPSGTITTTTAGEWVKPAANAFDDGTEHNNNDRSIHEGPAVDWIYTFDEPTRVNAYSVFAPGAGGYNYDKRMPKTWTFEAKRKADATWTVLDTQSNETGWSEREGRYYAFTNDIGYDSYRFAVTAMQSDSDGFVQIDELEFYFINDKLTDLTSPSGTITTTTAGEWVKPAANAFDDGTAHNETDRSIHEGPTVDWIYTFDKPTRVNAYAVFTPGTGCYNYGKRMPKAWTFEAKKEADATWTVLDTRLNETGWVALKGRYYAFTNHVAYNSYRFAVTALQSDGDGFVQIDELEFYYDDYYARVPATVIIVR